MSRATGRGRRSSTSSVRRDACRPRPTPFLGRRRAGGRGATHARVVHAPGRAVAARVPGRARRGVDPRRDQAPGRSPPRSRCSRSGGTASTRPCCSATSSCRPTPSGSASTSLPAPVRSPTQPLRAPGRSRPPPPARPSTTSRYVVDTVRLLAAELPADVPLLAFAGAPFTVASYLIEGRPSRDYRHTKALIHSDEALWHELMERLAESAITFIDAQLSNGAGAFQLFDSWAGSLSRRDYDRYVLPHSRRVFDELRDPPPRRARDPLRHRLRPPARIDARRRTDRARARLAHDDRRRPPPARRRPRRPGQPRPGARAGRGRRRARRRRRVLADNAGAAGHIFNLGHGVHPTPIPACCRRSSTSSTSRRATRTTMRA